MKVEEGSKQALAASLGCSESPGEAGEVRSGLSGALALKRRQGIFPVRAAPCRAVSWEEKVHPGGGATAPDKVRKLVMRGRSSQLGPAGLASLAGG